MTGTHREQERLRYVAVTVENIVPWAGASGVLNCALRMVGYAAARLTHSMQIYLGVLTAR
jgi:hypothetical protein